MLSLLSPGMAIHDLILCTVHSLIGHCVPLISCMDARVHAKMFLREWSLFALESSSCPCKNVPVLDDVAHLQNKITSITVFTKVKTLFIIIKNGVR